ncbi:hypothetical protein AJ79_01305 [Helicocarpus griseus UAMH5409]|uniref:Amidase domain-containing protein n=1 Tax=Helicocarpus griseus UAMH5409 TaxID=1447875 RepID=A0A2B7Y976_9EURO|nr:hypothetical protein AJ79_01305 [Helicocarpus griseus UAMH5409]
MTTVSAGSDAELKISEDTFRKTAQKCGVQTIEPDDVKDYTLLLNAADISVRTVESMPDYIDQRLLPDLNASGPRTYIKPDKKENPNKAWSYKAYTRLAGRTICVKDNIHVAGILITAGTAPKFLSSSEDYPISPIDATVVTRVLESGAVLKGTATCENLSLFALSYTSHLGVIENPWLPGTVGGGSSSGCAALLALSEVNERRRKWGEPELMGFGEGCDLAIGGDQGGSIRLPAAYAGIYGLKPTHGLVPYTGIIPLFPMIDHCGPMARTLRDTALLFSVIAGYDGLDQRMTPESPLRPHVKDYTTILDAWKASRISQGLWSPTTAATGLRIGLIKEAWEIASLDPEIDQLVRDAAHRFTTLGGTVEQVSIPLHAQDPNIWTAATRRVLGDYGVQSQTSDLLSFPLPHVNLPPPTQEFFDYMTAHNPAVTNVLFNSTYLKDAYTSAQSAKAHRLVHQLRAAYDAALDRFDVLITPANSFVGVTAPKSGEGSGVMDKVRSSIGSTSNTCPFNVTGTRR